MLWENSTLIRFIQDRSISLHESLLPLKPTLEGNPLFDDKITRKQIELRKHLDNIQGQDKDHEITGQMVKGLEIISPFEPIPKDNPYSNQDIGDYLRHLDTLEEWENYKEFHENKEDYNRYSQIDNIPILSCLYVAEKKETILVMSSNDNYIVELNTDMNSNIVGDRYRNQNNYCYRSTSDQISSLLYDVNFDELRKRLINSGYTELVNEINEHIQHY
jgi:hypothetical protein